MKINDDYQASNMLQSYTSLQAKKKTFGEVGALRTSSPLTETASAPYSFVFGNTGDRRKNYQHAVFSYFRLDVEKTRKPHATVCLLSTLTVWKDTDHLKNAHISNSTCTHHITHHLHDQDASLRISCYTYYTFLHPPSKYTVRPQRCST